MGHSSGFRTEGLYGNDLYVGGSKDEVSNTMTPKNGWGWMQGS